MKKQIFLSFASSESEPKEENTSANIKLQWPFFMLLNKKSLLKICYFSSFTKKKKKTHKMLIKEIQNKIKE